MKTKRKVFAKLGTIATVLSPLNPKNKKLFIAFALVLFMIEPILLITNSVNATGVTTGTFRVVQSGSTSVSSVTVSSSPNSIGTTVKFDIYISGANAIWGWAIPSVTWNPEVVHLTKIKEGPFLADNAPGGDQPSMAGTSSSLFDNVNGVLQGGLSEAIQGPDQSIDPSGVVATLTFTVVGYGNSVITIGGGFLIATDTLNSPQIPVSCNSGSISVQQPQTSINIYQTGSTSNSAIQWPSLQNPIGGTFKVDLYINNAVGVWEWNVGVTWDPNVIQLTNIAEGPYLSQNGATLFAPGYIDNYLGRVDKGISDSYTTTMSASASSGVLATLTFTIVTYSDCNINLTAGSPATLLNDAVPHQTIPILDFNNGTYSWNPAPATGPKAVITTSGSPLGTGSDQTVTSYPLTFDGTQATAGLNMVPPYQICPITVYSWHITLVSGTIVTATTTTVNLTAAQVGMNPGTISATLTVTAPSPTNTPSPTYTEIGSTTFTVQVHPSTSQLDIWTQNGGQGFGVDCTSFGPQQLVDLTGYVPSNGAPVVGKEVIFDIYSSGQYIDYTEAPTNATGYATASYRFPWQGSNPQAYFGVIAVAGSVEVSQVTLTDSCQFYYGYQLNLQSVTINNGIYDSNGVGPVFFRNYAGLNVVTLTATVNSTNWAPTPFYFTATVLDSEQVPVAFQTLSETAPAATGSPAISSNTQTYTISLTIPTWAFAGPAIVNVDILNGAPANGGLPFSPQQSASLYISNGS